MQTKELRSHAHRNEDSETRGRGRIAVFYPWRGLGALHCLRDGCTLLAQHGYEVEVYTVRDPDYPEIGLAHAGISIVTDKPGVFRDSGITLGGRPRCGKPYRWLVSNVWRPLWRRHWFLPWLRQRHWTMPYVAVVGMDVEGLVDAGPFALALGVPLVYWSLELRFSDEITSRNYKHLKAEEVEESRRAAVVIVQDEWRADALVAENRLDRSRVVLVPNAPMGKARRRKGDYLQEKLGISRERKIVLCTGGMNWWTMGKEIVAAAAHWPDHYLLVMHSVVASEHRSAYLDSLTRMADPAHVIVSTCPVPPSEYGELVDSADIGLALYNPVPLGSLRPVRNFSLIGLSSGKLADYLYRGLPVVVSDLAGPRELVSKYHCGMVVSDAGGVVHALEEISPDTERFERNACRAFDEALELESRFRTVVSRLDVLGQRALARESESTRPDSVAGKHAGASSDIESRV